MEQEVIKTGEFLKKTKWQRKTYPLKLNLTDIQKSRIENIVYEYKKGINTIINTILNDYFKNYSLQLTEEDYVEEVCASCQKKKKLKFILTDFEFVKYGDDKKPHYKPIYKKGCKTKVCEMCHCSHYSLRKFLYSTSKRDVPIPQWDFTKKFKLERGVWDSCVQKAVETIKSQVEIKKKINWMIKFYEKRIPDNAIKLNIEESKKIKNKEEIKKLKNYLRHDKKAIEKEKNKRAEKIEYKADSIRLYENSYQLIKDDGDYFIKIKDYSKNNWMTCSFYGKEYQKKLAEKFIDSKNAETEIVRKGEDFYLQYIYRKETKIPVPDKTFTAVGIDVNLINLASYVSMTKELKPKRVKFYSGRYMRHKRKRFSEMRSIWNSKRKFKENGGKGKSKKWFTNKTDAQNERGYIKFQIHKLTTNIVQEIKDKIEKPVIVLENLKDIRNRIGKELKIQKCSIEKLEKKQQKAIRGEKLLNKELNNWNFDDFQKFIEYKANWLGMPVVYVPAKDTSIKCNKCGNIQEENYKDYHKVLFKCEKCGYSCNADFNASVNIGRLFYENIKEQIKK